MNIKLVIVRTGIRNILQASETKSIYRTSRVTCSITEKDNAAGAKTSGEVKGEV